MNKEQENQADADDDRFQDLTQEQNETPMREWIEDNKQNLSTEYAEQTDDFKDNYILKEWNEYTKRIDTKTTLTEFKKEFETELINDYCEDNDDFNSYCKQEFYKNN